MKYNVSIDNRIKDVFHDMRLGLIRFKADVKESDARFWEYMNEEVLPQVRFGIMKGCLYGY